MEEMFRRRHLPHWDYPGATYFITACLDGSIPALSYDSRLLPMNTKQTGQVGNLSYGAQADSPRRLAGA